MTAIQRYAYEHNWVNQLWISDNEVEMVRKFRPHGFIYSCSTQWFEEIKSWGVPAVELCWNEPSVRAPSVVLDIDALGALAASHLLDRGFHRLVFMGPHPDPLSIGCGFKRTADAARAEVVMVDLSDPKIEEEVGFTKLFRVAYHDTHTALRHAWLRRFLAGLPTPAGIFVQSQVWAMDLIDVCLAMRIRVPEEIAVMCEGEMPSDGASSRIPMTVALHDFTAQGYRAAELLARMMNGEKVPVGTVVKVPPGGIMQRASTMCDVSDDSAITRVATFIMTRLHDPGLCVKQIQRFAKMPSSTLYQRFEARFTMPIAHYIERQRLDEARLLLATTDEHVGVIGKKLGFHTLLRFRCAFRRAEGMPPSEYRLKLKKGKGGTVKSGSVRRYVGASVRNGEGERLKVKGEGGREKHAGAKGPNRNFTASQPRNLSRRLASGPVPPRRQGAGGRPGATLPERAAVHPCDKAESKAESFLERLMRILASGPRCKQDLAHELGREKVDGQLNRAANTLVTDGLAERTIPDKPNSRLQQYRLTEKGRKWMRKAANIQCSMLASAICSC